VVRPIGAGSISIKRRYNVSLGDSRPIEKTVDGRQIAWRVGEVKKAGGKLVFTNGCLAIHHFGYSICCDSLACGVTSSGLAPTITRLDGAVKWGTLVVQPE
jgi:hypothetical protein